MASSLPTEDGEFNVNVSNVTQNDYATVERVAEALALDMYPHARWPRDKKDADCGSSDRQGRQPVSWHFANKCRSQAHAAINILWDGKVVEYANNQEPADNLISLFAAPETLCLHPEHGMLSDKIDGSEVRYLRASKSDWVDRFAPITDQQIRDIIGCNDISTARIKVCRLIYERTKPAPLPNTEGRS